MEVNTEVIFAYQHPEGGLYDFKLCLPYSDSCIMAYAEEIPEAGMQVNFGNTLYLVSEIDAEGVRHLQQI